LVNYQRKKKNQSRIDRLSIDCRYFHFFETKKQNEKKKKNAKKKKNNAGYKSKKRRLQIKETPFTIKKNAGYHQKNANSLVKKRKHARVTFGVSRRQRRLECRIRRIQVFDSGSAEGQIGAVFIFFGVLSAKNTA
jgi:hypothetical protein